MAPSGGDVVVGGAEEHELAVGEPRQDRIDLGDARSIRSRIAGKSSTTRRTSSTAATMASSSSSAVVVVDAVDLDLGPRLDGARRRRPMSEATSVSRCCCVALHGQHRVDEQVHAEPEAVEHHAHRVDEERHVVGDDEEHRVLRVPAVALALG